jgi:hypothetical protein
MDESVSEDLTLTLPEGCTNESPEITLKVYDSTNAEIPEVVDWPFTLNSPTWAPGTDAEGRTTYANAITSKEDAWGDYRIEVSLAGYTFTFGEEQVPVIPSGPQSVALHISPVALAVSLDESKIGQEREITLEGVTEPMYVMPVSAAKADAALLNAAVITNNPALAGAYLWTVEDMLGETPTPVSLSGVTADAASITLSNETLAPPSLYRVTCAFTAKGRVYTDSYYVLVYEITVIPAVSPATLEFASTGKEQAIGLTASFTTALSSSGYYEITGTGVAAWSSETTVETGAATHTVTLSSTYTDEFGYSWTGTATASGGSTYFVKPGALSNQSDTGATYTVTHTSYIAKTIYVPVSAPSSGGTYLIVDASGYALKGRSGYSTQLATPLSFWGPTTFYTDAEGASTEEIEDYLDPADLSWLTWTYTRYSSSSGGPRRSAT